MSDDGWDYVSARDNQVYSDSSWEIRNEPMVVSSGDYTLSVASAASIAGKAHVVAWSVPSANQTSAENAVLPVVYAAYQDWDGFFLTPYAVRREGLFVDSLLPGYENYTWNNIASNHALMSLLPAASEAFRKGRIMKADYFDTISHDAADLELFPHYPEFRGPFSQEGYTYGDEAIITSIGVRQTFDSPKHKVAAEDAFTPGDSVLRSEDGHIVWDPAHASFRAAEPTLYAYTGLPTDTISFPAFKLLRTDGSKDDLSLYYLMGQPSNGLRHDFLTIATRVQNSNTVWLDTLGFGKNSGTAPTVMSAITANLLVKSDDAAVTIYPLDSTGNRTTQSIPMQKNGNWFTASIDQRTSRSMWFDIVHEGAASVALSEPSALTLSIIGNPFSENTSVRFSLPIAASINLAVYDDLGRCLAVLQNGMTSAGRHSIPLAGANLPSGHYLLRLATPNGNLTRSFSVIR